MDKLPLELVEEILHHVPSSSVPTARLTSRTFNAILSRRAFSVLSCFIHDPVAAKATLTRTARDPARRTRAIWSPHCLVPERLPITESFLLALWVSLHAGQSWAPSSEHQQLTVEALQDSLGGHDDLKVTPETLRETMFRYALYLSYVSRQDKVAPQSWVFDFLLNRNAEVAATKLWGKMETVKQPPVIAYWEGVSRIDLK
ncbi:hypothetical protein B0T10DRAFT_8985 [Thelonectria olida]|uniref:F-box domain-containing protein n=1 Tax=Thelonectria olida TaxID=1576542 RepID=A0A9P8WI03_9HYPO|nr:hypothetical protein B0T10DRAFT_8985 [Thelonectria olida]